MARQQFGKAIGARRARKLIREAGGTPDDDLAAEWERVVAPLSRPDETVVRLSDGRILSISYGSARIFASADECLQLLAFVEQQTRRQSGHPLGTAFPGGQGFVPAVPELIATLPGKLHLAAGRLDGSVGSLTRLDAAVRQLGGANCLDDPNVLAPIIAYVGEVVRNATGGRWVIRSWKFPGAVASAQWQAVIIGADGREHPMFAIFKELLEDGSIPARIGYDIGHHRL
jgi:hypothetical protein